MRFQALLYLRVCSKKKKFSNKIYVVVAQKNRHNVGDSSFEHPKHMLKVMGKKINTILVFLLKNFVYLNLCLFHREKVLFSPTKNCNLLH